MKKYLPDKNSFIGKDVPNHPKYKIVEPLGSGHMGHVFKAHSVELNNDMACKIIPMENLKQGWQDEFRKANTPKSQVTVRCLDAFEWKTENGLVYGVSIADFVPGKTLEKYVQSQEFGIDLNFIERFLEAMLNLFFAMERVRLSHGDLHDKNVMVEDRSDQLGVEPYAFRVTDFGVAGASSNCNLRDDYDQLASMLKNLLEKVDYQKLSGRDKFSFDILRNEFLAYHLPEHDPTRDPLARNPRELFSRLKQIDNDFNTQQRNKGSNVEILTPFDFLSCEQIGEKHSLLKSFVF